MDRVRRALCCVGDDAAPRGLSGHGLLRKSTSFRPCDFEPPSEARGEPPSDAPPPIETFADSPLIAAPPRYALEREAGAPGPAMYRVVDETGRVLRRTRYSELKHIDSLLEGRGAAFPPRALFSRGAAFQEARRAALESWLRDVAEATPAHAATHPTLQRPRGDPWRAESGRGPRATVRRRRDAAFRTFLAGPTSQRTPASL